MLQNQVRDLSLSTEALSPRLLPVQLIPVFSHHSCFQLGCEGPLRGIAVNDRLSDRRLGLAPPGLLYFLVQALVRALGHPAQQRQRETGTDQQQQDHPANVYEVNPRQS